MQVSNELRRKLNIIKQQIKAKSMEDVVKRMMSIVSIKDLKKEEG